MTINTIALLKFNFFAMVLTDLFSKADHKSLFSAHFVHNPDVASAHDREARGVLPIQLGRLLENWHPNGRGQDGDFSSAQLELFG